MTTPDPIDIGGAVRILRAAANPVRLRILLFLRAGERSVREIETALGLHQPLLSQQLAMLRGAALISARREARSVVYRLMDGTTTHLVDALLHPAHEPSPMTAAAPRPVPSAAPTGRVAPRQSAVFATVGENA